MKFIDFLKKELSGWKLYETIGVLAVIVVIFINSFILNDSFVAVCSSVCGILYTIIAGKGKISCYFFGLLGSWCYIWLSYESALWGNMFLYLLYYIPMQVIGIFKWQKHLELKSREIIRDKLMLSERIKLVVVAFCGSLLTVFVLIYFNDKSPVIDGITTFLSILGMYLTVRRCIEQWIIWMIVNALSLIMWLNLVLHGTKAYATLVMWGVYFVLAIYFYILWNRSIYCKR